MVELAAGVITHLRETSAVCTKAGYAEGNFLGAQIGKRTTTRVKAMPPPRARPLFTC